MREDYEYYQRKTPKHKYWVSPGNKYWLIVIVFSNIIIIFIEQHAAGGCLPYEQKKMQTANQAFSNNDYDYLYGIVTTGKTNSIY